MLANTFPVEKIQQVEQNPDDFRLLQRAPNTLDQLKSLIDSPVVGDEIEIVILDLETDGLKVADCDVIEIGLISAGYSPSANRFTQVNRAGNYYEQPKVPISSEITAITGITNEMVEGKKFDEVEIGDWFKNDPLVVAHNASFDRPFFESRFNDNLITDLRWACSINGVGWNELGFGSNKLEYLLTVHGYFYEAHRALIDCMATLYLLHLNENAAKNLYLSSIESTYTYHAIGAPYAVKDELKANGYKWNPESSLGKHWEKEVTATESDEEYAFLSSLYPYGSEKIQLEKKGARQRFKNN